MNPLGFCRSVQARIVHYRSPHQLIPELKLHIRASSVVALLLLLPTTAFSLGIYADPDNGLPQYEILEVSALYDSTSLTFSATFEAGQLDPSTLFLSFRFDNDFDPSSGVPADEWDHFDSFAMFNALYSQSFARLWVDSDTLPLVFPSIVPIAVVGDTISIVVPLALIHTSGLVAWAVVAGPAINENAGGGWDYAPDDAQGHPLPLLSASVPEPHALALLLVFAITRRLTRRCS